MEQGCRGEVDPYGVRAELAEVLASSLPLAAVAVRDGHLDADQLFVISELVRALRADGCDEAVVARVEGLLVHAAVADPDIDLGEPAAELWEAHAAHPRGRPAVGVGRNGPARGVVAARGAREPG
ncbi:hypothetical protein [Actinomycetospora aeridis]|uniref:Uncharacterized protein n=1 Tax=Actinomycetospora aeridis TaxID=3129231 RepID=A0ABU8N7H2_9PSEU